jgi:hypothetical protein
MFQGRGLASQPPSRDSKKPSTSGGAPRRHFANSLAVGLPDLLFIVAKDKGDVDPRSQDLHAMAGSIVAGDFAPSGASN